MECVTCGILQDNPPNASRLPMPSLKVMIGAILTHIKFKKASSHQLFITTMCETSAKISQSTTETHVPVVLIFLYKNLIFILIN